MWFVKTDFLYNYDKIDKYSLVGAYMFFSSQKREFDRFFNRLDRPVEESRPDRFPSLVHIAMINRQASRLVTKLLMFHRFHGRHSTVLIVSYPILDSKY